MSNMQFKVDENLPVEVAGLLRAAGHDAVTVQEQNLAGSPDTDIAQICRQENRALLTLDTDFADIRAYPPSQYTGIVVLRLREQDKDSVLDVCADLVRLLTQEPLAHTLWIVDEHHLRIRS